MHNMDNAWGVDNAWSVSDEELSYVIFKWEGSCEVREK